MVKDFEKERHSFFFVNVVLPLHLGFVVPVEAYRESLYCEKCPLESRSYWRDIQKNGVGGSVQLLKRVKMS